MRSHQRMKDGKPHTYKPYIAEVAARADDQNAGILAGQFDPGEKSGENVLLFDKDSSYCYFCDQSLTY